MSGWIALRSRRHSRELWHFRSIYRSRAIRQIPSIQNQNHTHYSCNSNHPLNTLPGSDVLVMGHILHDWDLLTKKKLLAKAFDTLPQGGALLVYEALIDDERRENSFGLLMSLNMLIETPGGFDYTGADCQKWMRDDGFSQTRVEHLAGPDSMVIGIK